jgi:hypothetical protein
LGILYAVIPLTPDLHGWLCELGVSFPPVLTGRDPTPREIRNATGAMRHLNVSYNGDDRFTQACIESPCGDGTTLNIGKQSDPDSPCDCGFSKGSPRIIVEVVLRLSSAAGPLLLMPDTGDAPVVITPEKTIDEILAEWEHTRPAGPRA